MRNKLLILSVTIQAASTSIALGQEGRSFEDVVRAFHEVLASGDSTTALSLLAVDVVIYESGGVEASREEYRSHHLPADMAFASSTEREVTVERSGRSGDVAWVLSRARTTGTFRDSEIDSMGIETMLLVLAPNGWRIQHIHWSFQRAEPASGGS